MNKIETKKKIENIKITMDFMFEQNLIIVARAIFFIHH